MKLLAVLALLAAAACGAPSNRDPEEPTPISATDESEVLTAAERDLDCARDDIQVGHADGDEADTYVATGCGRTGRYEVSCTEASGPSSGHGSSCSARAIEEESAIEGED